MLVAALLLQGVGMVLAGGRRGMAPWLQRLGGAGLALFGAVLLGPFA